MKAHPRIPARGRGASAALECAVSPPRFATARCVARDSATRRTAPSD
ncbi:hypothetical protein C7S16_4715 [Burkholderia thailandensis]|uniref:Uncharacterized protein n=1 Tax=Burkholderia thailandensis TaxID=57975 RepID=A0AAW9CUV1_BURTH|nr:hypothetical protein [Burkholderia thailandensis]MDW9253456.1 hypothetical protein [Burkholderia thailandensis]